MSESWHDELFNDATEDQREAWFWAGLVDHLGEQIAEGLYLRPDASRPRREGSTFARILDFPTGLSGEGRYRLTVTVEVEPFG
jgi:hypothetical protein